MKAKIVTDSDGRYLGIRIKCPGCGEKTMNTDWLPAGKERSPNCGKVIWQFNGNLASPTFSPSLLWRSGHYCNTPPVKGECWCDFTERFPEYKNKGPFPECGVCHSFVRNGQIQFLNDCTHPLAGKTVELPDIE